MFRKKKEPILELRLTLKEIERLYNNSKEFIDNIDYDDHSFVRNSFEIVFDLEKDLGTDYTYKLSRVSKVDGKFESYAFFEDEEQNKLNKAIFEEEEDEI